MANGDDSENRRTLALWDTLIESQKSILRTLEASIRKSADVETAVTMMNRRVSHIEEQIAILNSKTDGLAERIVSVGRRFDEIEIQMDRNHKDLVAGQAEAISLENKILTAIQGSLNVEARADDLEDKLEQVRQRLGL